MALLLVLQCKVSQLLKVCNRNISSGVAGAHELVNMTVAHFNLYAVGKPDCTSSLCEKQLR